MRTLWYAGTQRGGRKMNVSDHPKPANEVITEDEKRNDLLLLLPHAARRCGDLPPQAIPSLLP
jgi:hypothetical protein